MPSLSSGSRVLVTGGCGFLGRHLVNVLRSRYEAVPFDVRVPDTDPSALQGSVTDAKAVDAAMEGVSGLVIGHMAPRQPGVYDSPELPFAINVQGAAMLLDAAARHGVKRVVLISSISVVQESLAAGKFLDRNTPFAPDSIYGLTKVLQEQSAQYYHSRAGLEIAILRPAYICLGDNLEDKYGVRRPSVNWQFIDPRDIGRAALAVFEAGRAGCESYYLVAGPGAKDRTDVARTETELSWHPEYRFDTFPVD